MNLYEYRCPACRTLFTKRRPMADRNTPAPCPDCGVAGRRVISTPQAHKAVWQQPQDPEALRTNKDIWK